MSFQDAMDEYNDAVAVYNHKNSELDRPKCAGQFQVSGGIEFTNNKNTVTGGIKGIYTRYSGFSDNKVTGNNYAAEAYGSVDVGHGIKINGAVNTNKVATVGVSITL